MQQKNSNDRNAEFLNKLYENSEAGYESISYLTDKIEDVNLLKDLQKQQTEYGEIKEKISKELSALGAVPKGQSPMAQIGMWTGVQMNTLIDKSADKIAEMMIQGSIMGIIDMVRIIKGFPDVPQSLMKIAEELITLEENSMKHLRKYLEYDGN